MHEGERGVLGMQLQLLLLIGKLERFLEKF
jgi:hypothetical protein